MKKTNGNWPPYQFAMVPVEQCVVDASYQRSVDNKWVTEKAGVFDPLLVCALVVSARSDEEYVLVDGQRRWNILRTVGYAQAPCLVFRNLSVQEEALLFAQLNFEMKRVTSWDHYKALRRGQEPNVLAIDKIVAERNFEIRGSVEHYEAIACCATVMRIYEGDSEYVNKRFGMSGPESLRRTLDVLNLSWRDRLTDDTGSGWRHAKVAGMIRGLSWFISTHPSVSAEDLAARALGRTNPDQIIENARSMTRGTGSGKGRKIEKVIEKLYGSTPKEPDLRDLREAEGGSA